MAWLHRIRFKVRAWWGGGRLEAGMAEEIRAHLERLEATHRDAGLSSQDARYAALRQFGNVAGIQERAREVWRFRFLERVIQDLRYSSRSLRGSPAFALAVVGSLVLGMGANVTLLTVMRAALWRPLPVTHPEQLVHVRRTNPASPSGRESSFSYVLFQQLRQVAGPAAQVIAKTSPGLRKFGLDPSSRERILGEAVSEDFFTVLGVRPAAGRVFVAGDDAPRGGERVAVLSERFWRSRFNADPAVVGRTVYYDESPFTIVGVAATGFDGVDTERRVQVWIPVTADVAITPVWLRDPSFYWLTLFARLSSTANGPGLQAALDARFRAHLEAEVLPDLSPRFRSIFGGERLLLRPAKAGLATTGRRYEPQLRVLGGVALCLFLICCANVASLARARNARRRDELALRRALGAGGGRILQQLLVEASLLGLLGTVGSLLAAPWIAGALIGLLPADLPLAIDLGPDLAIFAAAVALGTAATVLAITLPAWRERAGRTALPGSGRSTGRAVVSQATIAVQLATVLVLLVVAGLNLGALRRLNATELGFHPAPVMSVELSFPKGTPDARVSAALEAARTRLDASAGIEATSYAFPSVYDTGGWSMAAVPVDHVPAPGEDTQAGILAVGPGFFSTLQIPVRQGRTFASADLAAASPIVIVNETFARRYFAGRTAVGQAVRIPGHPEPTLATIVGVVGDVRHYGVRDEAWPMVYRPGGVPGARLLVRAREPAPAASMVRSALAAVDPAIQIETVRPLEEAVASMLSRERLLAVLSSVVAAIAMTLAALGLYGIVTYGVTCRRTEFGVRLALGAQRAHVRRLVLSGTLKLVAFGLVSGIPAAALASRVVSRIVPDGPGIDWPLMSGAALALASAMILAAWIPARRAARIDPASTLRYE
jgi:predicted permease